MLHFLLRSLRSLGSQLRVPPPSLRFLRLLPALSQAVAAAVVAAFALVAAVAGSRLLQLQALCLRLLQRLLQLQRLLRAPKPLSRGPRSWGRPRLWAAQA